MPRLPSSEVLAGNASGQNYRSITAKALDRQVSAGQGANLNLTARNLVDTHRFFLVC
jgi:hypothetical protein